MGTPSDLFVVYQDPRVDLYFRDGHVDEGSDPSMRKTAIFFLILLLSFRIPLVNSAPDEGYGEANENLGQFTDTFENDDNVSIAVNVINNQTLECMELNYTIGEPPGYEDFRTYTEVDANNRFAVAENIIVVESLARMDKDHYVYFDYGAGFFTDFTHDLDVRARDNSGVAGNDGMIVWMLTNYLDGFYDLKEANEDFVLMEYVEFDTSDPNDPNVRLAECVNNVFNNDFFEPAARNTWYFLRIVKSGTDLICGFYSTHNLRELGDGTDGDIDNLQITLNEDYSFRYLFIVSDWYFGATGVRLISGDIHNLDLNLAGEEGYETEGYFLTEDYLNYTTGESLNLLTNASLPPLTGITVQFSSDNVTWVDNHGNAGSSTVRANFSVLDLRDLNYSDIFLNYTFIGPGGEVTPRLYQSRIVTTNGTAGGAPGPGVTVIESDAPWIALAIILSIIAFLLAMRIKR